MNKLLGEALLCRSLHRHCLPPRSPAYTKETINADQTHLRYYLLQHLKVTGGKIRQETEQKDQCMLLQNISLLQRRCITTFIVISDVI